MLRPEAGVQKAPSLESAPLQKAVGRQLELSLPKTFGIDLEK